MSDECFVNVALPAVVMNGQSQEEIKNCQVNDELVGPIYLEGIRPSEQSVKGKDPK